MNIVNRPTLSLLKRTPSPLREEGGGEGVRAYRKFVTPHPNPLPMGEGAHLRALQV
jgi:hypothetical protein